MESPVPPTPEFIERDGTPMIFFDGAPTVAHFNGIVAVTLSSMIPLPAVPESKMKMVQTIVAHLRTNIQGALVLRDALNSALLLATPVQGEKN